MRETLNISKARYTGIKIMDLCLELFTTGEK